MKKPTKGCIDNSIRITANEMYDDWGKECLNISNFLRLFYIKGIQNGNPVTERTLKGYLPYITKLIEDRWVAENPTTTNPIPFDPFTFDDVEVEVEKGPGTPEVPEYIIVKFGDIERKYILEKDDAVEIERGYIPPPPTKCQYDGLFDYTNPKAIKIRRGKYRGTNIGSRKSVLQNFGNISWFYKWCLGQIERGKLLNYNDTEKNMKTLNDIIKWIDRKMTY